MKTRILNWITLVSLACCVAGAETNAPIPWDQIGATAGANYQGDGLTVLATPTGARLHCAFQRLNGEATREGLWLTSTVPDQPNDRFRVTAVAIGRESKATRKTGLPSAGLITLAGQTVRFERRGLIEEYSVSMDGVCQDFVVLEKPGASVPASRLVVELAVTGATVEPTASGAQLVLAQSGRRIAYSRLRVTDATGHELPARMEVDVAAARQSAADIEGENGGALPSRRYVALAVVVDDADAIYPVRIDPTFSDANWVSLGGIPGANQGVRAAVVDGFGNLYIGGGFTLVGETLANHVAKWNGSTWSPLGAGVNGEVRALAVSGSNICAGGDFTSAGGSPANRVAVWNGSSWSPLGSGMNQTVRALAASDAELFAGGVFTSAGSTTATNIAKWNGSSWSALDMGVNGVVNALAVSGSDLYAGGAFTTAGGGPAAYIARWNGTNWSTLGSGMDSDVLALTVSGGDVYAGGYFSTAGGNAADWIAKWNGNSWTALGGGLNGYVITLAVSGSNVFAGGGFTTADGSTANYVAKWNGSNWEALGSGLGFDAAALVVMGCDRKWRSEIIWM